MLHQKKNQSNQKSNPPLLQRLRWSNGPVRGKLSSLTAAIVRGEGQSRGRTKTDFHVLTYEAELSEWRYVRGFTTTYKNSTVFLEIDGNVWNSGICNGISPELMCLDVRCVLVVGCVATVFCAGSSKLVTCRIHLPRLRLGCGVWSFCFWTHLPTHARLHRHTNKHSEQSYVQSHSQMCCIPSDLKRLHEYSSMQLAFFQTHMQPHTQVHTLKYLYRHTAFLILDALAYTQGDLWGWLPLVLCVSLTQYYLVSKPQLSTETESWSGDGGNERGWKIEGKGVVRK